MNAITINDKNRTIEKSNTFAKAAAVYGTPEYNQLQDVRRAYPSYREVIMKQKGTGKTEFAKLSFNFMDKYIASHDVSDDLMAEYNSLRGRDNNGVAVDFQIVKDWFLNTFPEFEEFHAKRQALLEKIEAEKKARLAARKKVA